MILDQFIYTSASTKLKSGYQVTAKSKEITDEIIAEMSQYFYPSGLDPIKFNESRSLLLLKNNKIAYSKIRNIGIGYDGRADTLYNHTLVMNIDDFQKIGNDTRVLEEYYVEDATLEGQLSQIEIRTKIIPRVFINSEDMGPILKDVLIALFNQKKIAIFRTDKIELIENILTIVPNSLRLIPFSTLVLEPERQPAYHFILTERLINSVLEKSFQKIDPYDKSRQVDGKNPKYFEKSVDFLIGLIRSRDFESLEKIYTDFETINNANLQDKISLVTIFFMFEKADQETLKQEYAEEIMKILKGFDNNAVMKYFDKIKIYLKQYAILENSLQTTINPYTSLIDAFFLLPAAIMNEFYKTYLSYQRKSEEENKKE